MNDPSEILLYSAPNGAVKVDVFFKDVTVWLTQKTLAEFHRHMPRFLRMTGGTHVCPHSRDGCAPPGS